jgi:Glycosyltransferase family 10 (fucosyltransferase) C-term
VGPAHWKFDWKMTYELDSDVPVTYLDEYAPDFDRYHISYKDKKPEYFAMLMASNCQEEAQHRLQYAQELIDNGIQVISLGKCAHSHDSMKLFPECHLNGDTRGNKKCIMSKFKFYLAFENSRFTDYVTEKFWEVLDVGTIPVYRGAPNIKQLAPNPHSGIFVDDFASAKELAAYLQIVGNNEKLYNAYFDWKKLPLNPTFVKLEKYSWRFMQCNVCLALSKLKKSRRGV